ncbi:MAG: hypothetical protein WD794_07005 [Mycobacteriales bacterium]
MDDATAERLLRGRPVEQQPDLGPLAALLSEVRALGDESPTPTTALAALLRDGFDPASAPPAGPAVVPGPPRVRRRLTAVAGFSLALKVLTGSGVALAGVTSAAAAGVLPGPLQDGVTSVIRTLTPFDVAPRTAPPAAPEPAPPSELPTPGRPVPGDTPDPAPAPLDAPVRAATPPPAPQEVPSPHEERPGQPAPGQSPPEQPTPGRTGQPGSTPVQPPGRPTAAPGQPGSEPAPRGGRTSDGTGDTASSDGSAGTGDTASTERIPSGEMVVDPAPRNPEP